MIDAIEIGYAIKDRRAKLGLTQAQLAETAGISKRCLWSLELGQNPGVQLNKLTAVLGALGLDLTISTANVAEPSADTMSPSVQPKSHTVANTKTSTTADTAAGTTSHTSPSQHTSCTDPGMSSGTAKATEDNTASDAAKATVGNTASGAAKATAGNTASGAAKATAGNTGGTIDALSILTENIR